MGIVISTTTRNPPSTMLARVLTLDPSLNLSQGPTQLVADGQPFVAKLQDFTKVRMLGKGTHGQVRERFYGYTASHDICRCFTAVHIIACTLLPFSIRLVVEMVG
jgi:hypothetical protein